MGDTGQPTMLMVMRSNRSRLAASATMIVVLLNAVGCGSLPGPLGGGTDSAGSPDEPTMTIAPVATDAAATSAGVAARPTDAATPRTGITPPVAVRRGSIAQTLPLVGKVAAPEEVLLAFGEKLVVSSVAAKPGQTVEAGQVLVTADASEIQTLLDAARARLDSDTSGLAQAEAAAAKQQRTAAQQAAAAQQARADRVAAAQASLNNARAALQTVQAGPSAADIQAAESAVTAAQIAERKAEANQAKAASGADPALVRSAEQELANAQAAVVRAQADLDRMPTDVLAARQRLQMANDIAEAARTKLQALRQPDQNGVDSAQLGVDSAQAAVQAAQARVDQLRRGPPPADLRAAQNAVNDATTALARAQAGAGPPGDGGAVDAASGDISARQKAIDKDNTDIAKLEDRLAATQLVAPFSGTVVSMRVKAGDPVDPTHPAASIAKPVSPNVRATVTPADMDRVNVGQTAFIQLQGQPESGTPLSGTVSALTSNDAGTAKTAVIDITWPETSPKLGTVVNVGLVLQQKDDALLVPKKAVHTTNSRTFVELVDGTSKRVLNVQLGIVGASDAEIIGGLSLGQLVVVGP